jgi:cytidylate kinase
MVKQAPEVPAAVVERQMRRWALTLRTLQRAESREAIARIPQDIHPYVAISRQAEAGGATIARLVAQQLGVECLDKELLVSVAERYHLPRHFIEFVDETTSDWLLDLFGRWLDQRVVTPDDYIRRLGQIVLLAARHGSAVFVGRGVQCILPRERGLAVHIVAPLEMRIERAGRVHALSADAARTYVVEKDCGRRDFVRSHFQRDIADPTLYDLVLNVEHLGPATAGDTIVAAYRGRFGGGTSQ